MNGGMINILYQFLWAKWLNPCGLNHHFHPVSLHLYGFTFCTLSTFSTVRGLKPMFATQITIVLLHFHTPHLNPMFFGQFHILFLVTSKFPGKIEMCGGQTLI